MTSPAMRKFLGTKKKARPVPSPGSRCGAPPPMCASSFPNALSAATTTDNVVMYRCDSGGVRCLGCFHKEGETQR